MNIKPEPHIPVIITWDVDPDLWIRLEHRLRALNTSLDLCNQYGIRATYFVTACAAHHYSAEFVKLRQDGHEIGCHGLTHETEENYDQMPEEMQRTYIVNATTQLQTLIGERIRVFRAPRVKMSATTMKLLVENDYVADSSVCSQRLDLVSSNLINLGWVFAPRRPYHPHPHNPFKAGHSPIWEVPVSAVMLPFISTTLRVFGLSMMKVLFRLLYAEAKATGKPIVYLAHPTEFLGGENKNKLKDWRAFTRLEYFNPYFIRAHGLRMRNLLYRISGQTLIDYTQNLFEYISSFPNIKFMTLGEYVSQYLEQVTSEE
jgi:peptidoglycan-N-acetylglucosamine deacetylase